MNETKAVLIADRRKLIASYNAIRIERDELLERFRAAVQIGRVRESTSARYEHLIAERDHAKDRRIAELEALLSAVCKIENDKREAS
jgi:hypothetical protein